MSLNKIWVHAEIGGDKPSSISLELITKARELGGTVEAFYAGENADAVAAELGKYGVSKLYTIDTQGHLQGVPVASALAAAIEGGNAPDLVMFGTTYDGRDVMASACSRSRRPTRAASTCSPASRWRSTSRCSRTRRPSRSTAAT